MIVLGNTKITLKLSGMTAEIICQRMTSLISQYGQAVMPFLFMGEIYG